MRAGSAHLRSVLPMDRHGGLSLRQCRVTLDPGDIEAIAERAALRVVELLGRPGPGSFELLEPRQLAEALNVSVDYVYAHAADLGAMRLGDSPKARLRFDLHTAQTAMRSRKQPPAMAADRR
jgi:hypothetical protein